VASVFPDPSALGEGPALATRHLLVFSLPAALLCALAWGLCARVGWVEPPQRPRAITAEVRDAVVLTAVFAPVGAATALYTGFSLGWHWSTWSALGNVFSNLWEEVVYRGWIGSAMLGATGSRAAAVLMSGAVFAYTHSNYPPALQAFVGATGAGLMLLWLRHRSLFAPWLAHQLLDMILDTVLT